MDNLVSVFKSMEVAAGTSIVATPLSPSPKVAGKYIFFLFCGNEQNLVTCLE
jgi:hypothetical protein